MFYFFSDEVLFFLVTKNATDNDVRQSEWNSYLNDFFLLPKHYTAGEVLFLRI